MRITRSVPLMAMVFSIVLLGNAQAQTGTATITGSVTDQTGAAVPGALVTIKNPSTSFTRSTTSNQIGIYRITGLPPSTYRMEVRSGNFNQAVNKNVQAPVDSTVVVNFLLEPGVLTVTIDVTSRSIDSVVNTQDASLGNTFVPAQITQLPTALRRVVSLMTLQPGVTMDGYVTGNRSDQPNITLDGVDINDQQTSPEALRLSTEAVEEFRITTLNPNANQGRSSGAQISMITRGGSNALHGAGFYFYRPTKWSANNFFNNATGRYEASDPDVINGIAEVGDERVPRPSLSRDVFGGRLGGPIIKDKAFFFYSYEGQRQRKESPLVRLVPLAHMGQGMLKFLGWLPGEDRNTVSPHEITLGLADLNNIYDQVGINPAVVALFADVTSRYPVNDRSVGDGFNTGGFRFNSPIKIKENTHIARFDVSPAGNHNLFFRGNYQWDNSGGLSVLPDAPGIDQWTHPYGWAVGHDWVIGSNRINNFRWGFTRQAMSFQGDSSENSIVFWGIFAPSSFSRESNRTTATQNFTDDFSWVKGAHTLQFGGNVRLIRNSRKNYDKAYDSASTHPFGYPGLGGVLDVELQNSGYAIAQGQELNYRYAASALIGRFPRYSVNFNFDKDGSVLPERTPSTRNFATEEYDAYFQDIWKPRRDLTFTLGLRYALSRPVYEQTGFQVAPTEPLGDFFDRRVASSQNGIPMNDLIDFQLAGPKNDAPGFYKMDTNNLQPRIAAAWSPSFERGFFRRLFGETGTSTFRGGFAITNDYFGQQLAVGFDGLSTIGFTSSWGGLPAGTYNVTNRPAPLFTGFDQTVRSFPGIPVPAQLFSVPADEVPRIQSSLDSTIVSPIHYTWNLTYGRSFPKGLYVEASYIGRRARHLFASRDIMALNNLVDPASGMDWYTAAGLLVDARIAGIPITSLAAIPYFENLFPNAMAALGIFGLPANNNTQAIFGLFSDSGFRIRDYTLIQLILDDSTAYGLPTDPGLYPNMFFHPQYAALSAYGTTAYSNYNAGTLSIRQRLGETLSYDINYTFSRSMDNASGLQTSGTYGTQFILNSLRPDDSYAVSDFDIRHLFNANFIFRVPFGQGERFGSGINGSLDKVLGGWQLAGVFRWNTGAPIRSPFDQGKWATNWNITSNVTRIGPIPLASGGSDRDTQNIFSDPQAAFNNFRNARPGETGERNMFRQPDFHSLDLGLSKSFEMPWRENHRLQVRWEVFNVLNFQPFSAGNFGNLGVPSDPETGTAPPNFGKIFVYTQSSPRSMQFGLRYEF